MDREIWRSFQRLNLGVNQDPIQLQPETRRKTAQNSELSLIARCLNPRFQRPKWMKNTLPVAWKMESKVTGQVNDNETVQFFFQSEHHLMTVLEGGPWSFKEWMVAVDRWSNRRSPRFLRDISFWVQIYNIPNEHRNYQTVIDIGSTLGRVEEINIKDPTREAQAEVWVKITMDVSRRLIFSRYLDLQEGGEPILLRFVYDKLRKFCRRCGSLLHDISNCSEILVEAVLPIVEYPAPVSQFPPQAVNHDMDDPYEENDDVGDGFDRVENVQDMQTDEEGDSGQNDSAGQRCIDANSEFNRILNAEGYHPQDPIVDRDLPLAIREAGSPSGRGSKRKAEEHEDCDLSPTSKQKLIGEWEGKGLVVSPKPPQEP